jgi:hypothetical protein
MDGMKKIHYMGVSVPCGQHHDVPPRRDLAVAERCQSVKSVAYAYPFFARICIAGGRRRSPASGRIRQPLRFRAAIG